VPGDADVKALVRGVSSDQADAAGHALGPYSIKSGRLRSGLLFEQTFPKSMSLFGSCFIAFSSEVDAVRVKKKAS